MPTSTVNVGNRKIEVSNSDKLLFTDPKISKQEFVEYYDAIAETMMKHISGRPLALNRFPDGVGESGFIQQRASDHFPDWVSRVEVESNEGPLVHPVCDNKATLVYLAGQATIEFHSWHSRKDSLDKPDRLVFDIDPEPTEFKDAVSAAQLVEEVLEETGLPSYAMLTGSKGIHVVVPIEPRLEFDEVREFAKAVGELCVEREPDLVTTAQRKNARGKRVFLDTVRNSYGQSTITPYSTRARDNASVAAPISWEQLTERRTRPDMFTLRNVPGRVRDIGDLWSDFNQRRHSLDDPIKKLEQLSNG